MPSRDLWLSYIKSLFYLEFFFSFLHWPKLQLFLSSILETEEKRVAIAHFATLDWHTRAVTPLICN